MKKIHPSKKLIVFFVIYTVLILGIAVAIVHVGQKPTATETTSEEKLTASYQMTVRPNETALKPAVKASASLETHTVAETPASPEINVASAEPATGETHAVEVTSAASETHVASATSVTSENHAAEATPATDETHAAAETTATSETLAAEATPATAEIQASAETPAASETPALQLAGNSQTETLTASGEPENNAEIESAKLLATTPHPVLPMEVPAESPIPDITPEAIDLRAANATPFAAVVPRTTDSAIRAVASDANAPEESAVPTDALLTATVMAVETALPEETASPTAVAVQTETPAIEETATEVPVTEIPVTEAPVTEIPLTEAPATEVPVTEAPAMETPVTETSVTAVPVTETPVAEEPAIEVPATEVPATEVPVTEVPVTKVPVTEVPVTKVPVTEVPVTEVPITEVPVTEVPVTEVPVTEVPVTEVPITETPATKAPVTEATITEVPVTEVPVTEVPVTEVPVTEAPVTKVPVTQVPITEVPTTAVPVTETPVVTASVTEIPEGSVSLTSTPPSTQKPVIDFNEIATMTATPVPAATKAPGIVVPGWKSMTFDGRANQEHKVNLYNPIENDGCYYLTYTLYIVHEEKNAKTGAVDTTYEEVFATGLIAPGQAVDSIQLTHDIKPGTYPGYMFVQPYIMDSLTATRNVGFELTLTVTGK